MKKLLLSLLILLSPGIALAQLTTHGGGTGLLDISAGSIPFGSVFNLRLATSSGFQWTNATNNLLFTYGSSTAISATTLCLTGDTCRTTWPSGGSSAFDPFTHPTNFATTTSATTTPMFFTSGIFASTTRGGPASQFDNSTTTLSTVTNNLFLPFLVSTGFVKTTGGVLSVDTNSYLTALGSGWATTTASAVTLSTTTSTTNGITSALSITCTAGACNFQPSQSGTLSVGGGGTGQSSFKQGWLGVNDSGAFIASTSPTFAWITATSTATSTFTGGINLSGTDCFAVQGTCLQTFIQNATAYKQAVNYATAAVLPGTPTYSNGVNGVGATLTEVGFGALVVDGQTVTLGQRILVKNQADQTQNGIYTVSTVGSGIASYLLTRSTDYNSSLDIYAGTTVPVLAGGTANGDTQWTESTTGTITVGTSNITFIETSFGTSGTVTSVGLSSTNSTLSIGSTPITTNGTITADINLAHANIWTALQQFSNATSTQLSATKFYAGGTGTTSILSTGEISSIDATTAYTGQVTPLVTLILQTGTTTTWTATTSAAYIPSAVAPFAGTLRDISCVASTTKSFLGVTVYINSTPVSPTYFISSSTAGVVPFTSTNTFVRGDLISAQFGTTTSDANAVSDSCAVRATQTP